MGLCAARLSKGQLRPEVTIFVPQARKVPNGREVHHRQLSRTAHTSNMAVLLEVLSEMERAFCDGRYVIKNVAPLQ